METLDNNNMVVCAPKASLTKDDVEELLDDLDDLKLDISYQSEGILEELIGMIAKEEAVVEHKLKIN